MKLGFSRQFSKKNLNIKFNKNPSGANPVVVCGRKDEETDITKLTVAFPNFANEPKMKTVLTVAEDLIKS
jgi:hypothetical protein